MLSKPITMHERCPECGTSSRDSKPHPECEVRRYRALLERVAVMAGTTDIEEAVDAFEKIFKSSGTGVMRIAQERRRQIGTEGYYKDHDDTHTRGELAMAAVVYAAPEPVFDLVSNSDYRSDIPAYRFVDPWPWGPDSRKKLCDRWNHLDVDPSSRRALALARLRDLERAGALIAAEIDRIDRLGWHHE